MKIIPKAIIEIFLASFAIDITFISIAFLVVPAGFPAEGPAGNEYKL